MVFRSFSSLFYYFQGRVADGKSGLFPQSYTSPIPPTLTSTISHDDTQSETTPTLQDNTLAADSTPGNMTAPLPSISLQTLTEEPESHTVTPDGRDHSAGVQGEGGENGDAEMMRATMTDVQQAIEQLGRTNDRDGSRSFSFASSHGDYTDRELTETENETDGDADGDGVGENEVPWHRGVREKLAERARKDNEERMARESRDREESVPSTPMRSTAPPIDVELSDESDADDEDEEHRGSHSQTVAARRMSGKRASDPMPSPRYPHIPEESEDEQSSPEKEKKTEAPPPISAVIGASRSLGAIPVSLLSATTESGHIIPSEDFIVPIPDDTDLPTATPEQLTFPRASPTMPVPVSAPAQIEASTSNLSETPIASPTPLRSVASGQNIVTSLSKTPSPPPAVTAPESAIPTATMVTNPSSAPPMKSVPSAIRVAEQLSFAVGSALPSPSLSSNGSVGIQQTLTTPATTAGASVKTTVGGTPPPTSSLNPLSSQSGIATEVDLHPSTKKHPSEWSVEEVIEWLKSKGFDQGVCDKFEEQEITGDVLLELDANVLKAEIGIVAFGKRIRIVNAINELKRPPSITDSEPKAPVPQMMGGVSMLGMGGTSRSHSISYSHSHSASMQSSTHHSFNNLNTAGGSSSLAFPLPQSLSPALSNSLVMPGSPSHLTMGGNSSAGTQGGFNPPYSAGLGSMLSNDSSPLTSEFPAPPPLSSSQSQGMFGLGRNGGSGWRASDPGIDEVERVSTRSFVGLGFATGESSSNGRVLVRDCYKKNVAGVSGCLYGLCRFVETEGRASFPERRCVKGFCDG